MENLQESVGGIIVKGRFLIDKCPCQYCSKLTWNDYLKELFEYLQTQSETWRMGNQRLKYEGCVRTLMNREDQLTKSKFARHSECRLCYGNHLTGDCPSATSHIQVAACSTSEHSDDVDDDTDEEENLTNMLAKDDYVGDAEDDQDILTEPVESRDETTVIFPEHTVTVNDIGVSDGTVVKGIEVTRKREVEIRPGEYVKEPECRKEFHDNTIFNLAEELLMEKKSLETLIAEKENISSKIEDSNEKLKTIMKNMSFNLQN